MTIKYNLEIRYRGQKAIFSGLELDDEQAADESVKAGEEHNTYLATEHFWANAELSVMRKEDPPPPRRLLDRDVRKGQWLQTQGGTRRGLRANPPAHCDICDARFLAADRLYDGKTKNGPWAWMCPTCFRQHGTGLGVGIGQEYEFIPG